MSIDIERFSKGFSITEYISQMNRNRDVFEDNMQVASIRDEDRNYFKNLPDLLNVLVITEDWCTDALAEVPVLARIAEETGKLNIKIFLRDQNLDIADQYLKDGKYRSVPVFVFFDSNMNQLTYFIERSKQASEEMNAVMTKLAEEHPEIPDLRKSFGDQGDEAKALTSATLKELRTRRGEVWTHSLLDEIRERLDISLAQQSH